MVAPEGGGDVCLALGEGGGVYDDDVEAATALAPFGEDVERVAGHPVDIGQPVQRRVFGAAGERLVARVERGDRCGPLRQVQGERAVIGETIERAASGRDESGGEKSIVALVEKRSGLLAGPRCGE